MKRNKFHAKKITNEYGTWDSIGEFNRFLYLQEMQDRGIIFNLCRQVKFEIIPAQYKDVEVQLKTKKKIKKKLVERKAVFTVDFTYKDINGNMTAEDFKSEITAKETDYILRRKLLLYTKGIELKEVYDSKKKSSRSIRPV